MARKKELTARDKKRLATALHKRLDVLAAEIDSELDESEHGEYAALAGDEGDRATEDVISDTRLFDLQRDETEIGAVRAALDRLADDSYGLCIDCGTEIDLERLEAEPWAPRCLHCQQRWETEHARLRSREI